MQIAYFLNDFPALSQIFILNQITGMIDSGAEVQIYAFRKSKATTIQKDVLKYNLLSKVKYIEPLPQGRLAAAGRIISLLFSRSTFRDPMILLNTLRLKRNVRSQRAMHIINDVLQMDKRSFDIIHCQFGTIGPRVLNMIETGKLNGKLVVSFRGYDATKYVIPYPTVYSNLFEKGDLFLPVSESLRNNLIGLGCSPGKIQIMHSGLKTERFTFRLKIPDINEDTKVLTIARLVHKKGLNYAIDAVARSIAAGKKLQYYIIGEGPLQTNLQHQIDNLGMSDDIHLLGPKTHKGVLELLDDSHILIAPSVTAKDGDMEGIPNVIKEAMAIGLPVIGTNHGGIPELVQHGQSGFLVEEKDAEALSEALSYLCDHPETWLSVCSEARTVIEKEYDIIQLNQKLSRMYKSLVQDRQG